MIIIGKMFQLLHIELSALCILIWFYLHSSQIAGHHRTEENSGLLWLRSRMWYQLYVESKK